MLSHPTMTVLCHCQPCLRGAPSLTPAPGRLLAGSWRALLSQGRCRGMGKSRDNLPKAIQPFPACSQELHAHRGCFWRVNHLLRFLPSLFLVLQQRSAPMPASTHCSPRDLRRLVSGSPGCGTGWPRSCATSCQSGLHCAWGVMCNPTRGRWELRKRALSPIMNCRSCCFQLWSHPQPKHGRSG